MRTRRYIYIYSGINENYMHVSNDIYPVSSGQNRSYSAYDVLYKSKSIDLSFRSRKVLIRPEVRIL